jgi:hypothetical protein
MAVKLITADAVIQRMSLGDHEDILNSVDSALTGVSALVSSTLDTKLDPLVDTVEVFLPDVNKYWATTPQGLLRIRLRNGFVNPGTVELKSGDTLASVRNHQGTVVSTDDYDIDYERGYIYLNLVHDLKYLSVKYSSGILVPAGLSEPSDVPDWLQEVALAYVPVVMNQNQTTNRSAEMEPVLTALSKQAATILDAHARNLSFTHSPIL